MKIKRTALTVPLVIVLLIVVAVAYFRLASPTHVAMVNYPEYMLASQLDQKLNPMIKVSVQKWDDQTDPDVLKQYDVIYFFGMGLKFNDRQQQVIQSLIERKVPVHVSSSTRQETGISTLSESQSEAVRAYMSNGGKENFRRLMNYSRRHLDGKILFNENVEEPYEVPRYAFFHTDPEKGFLTYEEFLDYYRKSGIYNPNHPTVCIFGGNGGGKLSDLIRALEKHQINVVAANGMGNVDTLRKVNPDLVIYQPHGRFSMRDPDAAIAYLKERNIPLFCPIKVSQPYEEFLKDQRGMTGGMLSQSVIMPELDGGAVPYVLSALFPNQRGLMEFRMIPDRLERFSEMVYKTLQLKRKNNAEKKIAIIYYKGPGQNAMVASGLEVGDSLLNTLRHLKRSGFNTGELPETPDELNKLIQKNAAVFGSYAQGAFEEFVKTANVEFISYDQYLSWVRKALPDDLFASVEEAFGKGFGRYFTHNGKLAIGMLRFGNIVLIPQGLPGLGDDANRVIHGTKQAPPHSYLATYLWIRYGFQADAMMHFGTHGSLEFTPWKQIALSSYDWPDVLVGEMPHYYLYVINNVGEALIAKRRSYATIVSHLTAPFMNSGLHGALTDVHNKIHDLETAEDPMLKNEYKKSIIEFIKKEKLDQEIRFSDNFAQGQLNDDDLELLHNHIHELETAKVNRGLYVIGRPYSKDEADETAQLMMIDTVAGKLFDADLKQNLVTEKDRERNIIFDKYTERARQIIADAFKNPPAQVSNPKTTDATKSVMPKAMPEAMRQALANMPEAVRNTAMRKFAERHKQNNAKSTPAAKAAETAIPEAMMQALGHLPEAERQAAIQAFRRRGQAAPKPTPDPVQEAIRARSELISSTQAELESMVNAFNGGYISPSSAGDPVINPASVPTGRNLYGIDPDRTPTRESYAVGKKLGEALIAEKIKTTGDYPKKAAFSLWGGEFIRTQGVNIGEIFFLLGVEPVWDSRGRVQDVRLIPNEVLKRPRIDVVVQTSGQFRGAATSRMRLIDKAVKLAAEAPECEFVNYVAKGSDDAIKVMIEEGLPPEQARKLSHARIFGGLNGNFGTGITGMVQAGDRWDDSKDIAERYLHNMGTMYTDGNWGEYVPGVFKGALQNTDTVVHSRSSNTWGPLSLDHVYEFMGGINLTIRHVTGKEPDAYFNDLRTPGRARIQDAGQAAMVEARTTVLNPKYLKEMMQEGPSGAATFAEVFRNTYGWEVMKPDMLQDHLWEEYKKVFIDDVHKLNMREYFEKKNPYALQEMTAVMLETIRKDLWKASPETIAELAKVHAELVSKHGPGCSGFVCNNLKLRDFIKNQSNNNQYAEAIDKVRNPKTPASQQELEKVEGMTLKEQKPEPKPVLKSIMENKTAIIMLAIIIAIGVIAICWGNHRRHKNENI
jgi:cobaltochelatase CobN